ncbi:hypothetical protein RB595_010698 [Gaeumannomyces hyphopodioides]
MGKTPAHPNLPQAKQVPATPSPRTSDSGDEPAAKRTRLTRKNLALFDKMGNQGTSNPTGNSKSTKTTSTSTSGFAKKAHKNGILHPAYSKPPANLEKIRERHNQPRASVSPPESEYADYAMTVSQAFNEATMVYEVGSRMLKIHGDKGYMRAFNLPLSNIPQNAGYNNGLSAPQPDFIEGPQGGMLPFADEVPGANLHKKGPFSLTLPHIAGEWKGPGKDIEHARVQAAYDGAAMVHARNQALAYMGKSDPPGHAAVTTFDTDGDRLRMYAHYSIPSKKDADKLEYHQYQYASTGVLDSYQGHKDGRKGLRNAQDYARDQSYALKDQLEEHWEQQRSALRPIAEEKSLPVPDEVLGEVSADEEAPPYEDVADEDDYEAGNSHPCQPMPAASTGSRKASRPHASSGRSHISDEGGRKSSSPPRAPPRPRNARRNPTRFCRKHSNGTISWFNSDNDDEN